MTATVIGIDLGGTNVKGALVTHEGQVIDEARVPTDAAEGAERVVGRMAEVCRRLGLAAEAADHEVLGLGVGAPGPLDSSLGVVVRCPNLPGWDHFPLAERLRARTGLAVSIENDANAAAVAEAWCGAGAGRRHVVTITLGTGVGSGVIVDGALLKGRGFGGELGHMIVREGGRLCGCGARGCLEAYASASAVARRAAETLGEGGPAVRRSVLAGTVPTCESVFRAAAEGDDLALRVVNDTARYLAAGLASVVNIFHPEVVVLTGGMIRAGEDLVLGPTRKYLAHLALRECLEGVQIMLSPLQDRAGVLGAAAVGFAGVGRSVLAGR